jgi:hypothetical protein
MRKIHPSKNGGGLGRTFSLWQFLFLFFAILCEFTLEKHLSPNFPTFKIIIDQVAKNFQKEKHW